MHESDLERDLDCASLYQAGKLGLPIVRKAVNDLTSRLLSRKPLTQIPADRALDVGTDAATIPAASWPVTMGGIRRPVSHRIRGHRCH
jgi:hypothetical protein